MKKFAQVFVVAVSLLSVSAWAGGGGAFKPILGGGLTYLSGDTTKSLGGASEKAIVLMVEQAQRYLRLTASSDFGLSSGTGYMDGTEATYSMFNADLSAGINLFPFKETSFQPFFGAKGILGLHRFSMDSPPGALPTSSQGFHYGYDFSIGIDLRFKKGDKGTGVRLYGSLRSVKGTVATISGFDLGGFRFGAGIIF